MLKQLNLIKHLFCLMILIAPVKLWAQTHRAPYTLLWEIKGNGLTKPSYLFGTMHVRNPQVFHFSDSVMVAIEKCNGFALEVHPDTITRIMLNAMVQNDTTNNLRKLLGDSKFDELSKKFEKKNGYAIKENMNPLMVESLLKDEKTQPGEKEAFVDAYLYGIARTMNKTIYGLENAAEQFNAQVASTGQMRERLLELLENDGYGENTPDEMVELYSAGNLDNILKFIDKYNIIDSSIIERNKVMAASMIKYMQNGPLFTAVGVAHLPGEYGVIALLRQAGYTVNAVPGTFTGVAARYKIDYTKIKWVTHTNEAMGYSLQFPSQPLKTKISGVDTYVYADLGHETYYGVYSIKKGTDSYPTTREKVLGKMMSIYRKNKLQQIIVQKQVTVNGLPCTYVITKAGDNYERMGLLFENNTLYILYAGNHLASLTNASSNKFFNSFKSFKPAQQPEKSWVTITKDTAAFSIQMPGQPTELDKEVPNNISKDSGPFKLKMYLAIDSNKLNNYIVRYNDYPSGTYLANKQLLFDGIGKEYSSKGKLLGAPVKIWKDGFEGREVSFVVANGYHCLLRIYMRGNRQYLLMQLNAHDGEAALYGTSHGRLSAERCNLQDEISVRAKGARR
jgi:uncharacterized protein YbaP (TraB family)